MKNTVPGCRFSRVSLEERLVNPGKLWKSMEFHGKLVFFPCYVDFFVQPFPALHLITGFKFNYKLIKVCD
jgi:hypothetical protein